VECPAAACNKLSWGDKGGRGGAVSCERNVATPCLDVRLDVRKLRITQNMGSLAIAASPAPFLVLGCHLRLVP